MKSLSIFSYITLILLITTCGTYGQQPTIFISEILNDSPNIRDISIAPQGNELYVSLQSYKKEFASIVRLTRMQGVWQDPKIASFSGQYTDIEAALDPSGLKLYFASNRPQTDTSSNPGDFDIWYVKRSSQDSPWSAPINMGAPVNSSKNEFYPSVAANGNLYFTRDSEAQKEDIFLACYKDHKYAEPVPLPQEVNSPTWEFNAYIAPDELYIIFSSYGRADDLGGGDLYISYKDSQNNWTPAINLGPVVNSDKLDYCPFVDIKSNVFYFTSEKSEIKPSYPAKMDLNQLKRLLNKNPNGQSRIYSIPFEEIAQ